MPRLPFWPPQPLNFRECDRGSPDDLILVVKEKENEKACSFSRWRSLAGQPHVTGGAVARAGCGGSGDEEEKAEQEDPTEATRLTQEDGSRDSSHEHVEREEQGASREDGSVVVVRVSGTETLPYAGNYGTLEGEPQAAVDAVVEHEPTDYEVPEGNVGGAFGSFSKSQPGEGELKVQIVAGGVVVAESITYTESGWGEGSVRWSPQGVEEVY
jgi:hypothetical protein